MSIVPPVTISDDRTIRMPLRTLVIVIGALAAGFASWMLLRYQVAQQAEQISQHTRQIETLGNKLDTQHDLLLGISEDVKILTRDRAPPAR